MIDIFEIVIKASFSGCAAIGFAILFNVPVRTLFPIFILGFIGGFVKFICMYGDFGIVISSLLGATIVGTLAVPTAHKWYSPPLVFSIAAVIPMVPGAFAYRMILGFIDLSASSELDYMPILLNTFRNASKLIFTLASLSFGVAIPMLVTRKESVKRIEHFKNN